jgi:hypothetical protein
MDNPSLSVWLKYMVVIEPVIAALNANFPAPGLPPPVEEL